MGFSLPLGSPFAPSPPRCQGVSGIVALAPSLIRHPEVRAKRASNDERPRPRPSPFEGRGACHRRATSGRTRWRPPQGDGIKVGENRCASRERKVMESIGMIERIWAQDPPYKLKGEFWNVQLKDAIIPEL